MRPQSPHLPRNSTGVYQAAHAGHLIPTFVNCDSRGVFPDAGEMCFTAGERLRFAMALPLPLRSDFTAVDLRRMRVGRHAAQARRLLALAAIYDGGPRAGGGADRRRGLQIVRDWVVRFNARWARRPDRPQGAWAARRA